MLKRKFNIIVFIFGLVMLITGMCLYASTVSLLHESKEIKNEIKKCDLKMEKTFERTQEALQELDVIYTLAEKYNLEPELILAMMKVESNFNPNARSSCSSGILQIHDIHNVANVFDLKTNIEYSSNLLASLKKESKTLEQMLGKYNYGSAGYRNYVRKYKTYTTEYSEKVTKLLNELKVNAE